EKFDKAKQAYVVITPNAMSGWGKDTALSSREYERKVTNRSVLKLGRLLGDGPTSETKKKIKPKPALSQASADPVLELNLVTMRIAQAAGGGAGKPPNGRPPFGLGQDVLDRPSVRIDPKSIKIVGMDVMFSAEIYPHDASKKRTIWVRTGRVRSDIRDD